ncbi:MAG: YncE family protein [Thermoplasmata archaeon]|nr:YncE family protein [Thermoplasmata archaeon]
MGPRPSPLDPLGLAIVFGALILSSSGGGLPFGTVAGASVNPLDSRPDVRSVGAAPLYPQTFTETGLPSGSPWNITLNGQTQSVVAPLPIVFSEPNGTYAYTVGGPSGWELVPPSATGIARVAGAPNTVALPNIGVGTNPYDTAYDTTNGYVYVANLGSNNVTAIDGATDNVVVPGIGVGTNPLGITYDPSNGYLYVTNYGSNNVTVIDGATEKVVVPSIGVGSGPNVIAFDPSNGFLYVVNGGSNNVTVIDGATDKVVVPSIGVGATPTGIVQDRSNGYLYVANYGSNNLSVIDGATNKVVVPSIGVGMNPYGIASDPANGYLYVVNFGSNNVTVVNGATEMVAAPNIGVGANPDWITYDPSNGYLYVANFGSNTVTVIDGATGNVVVPSIGVGSGPSGIAFDSSNRFLYVTNYGSTTVTVINGNGLLLTDWKVAPRYPVTFPETGLPSGTIWLVTLNGAAGGSAGPTITFQEPNGTYTYTIAPIAGWTVAMYRGSLTVPGAPTGVAVAWTQTTYPVAFAETGLPSGRSWSVTVNGAPQNSTTSTITFAEPNGTYAYMISSVGGYSVAPSFGVLTVKGPNLGPSIVFSPLPPPSRPGFLGLSGNEGYLVVGGIAAVVAIGAGFGLLLHRRQARQVKVSEPDPKRAA